MSRDAIYFLAPTRAGGWCVRRVVEHGRYHAVRPTSWTGPYATALDARRAADETAGVMPRVPMTRAAKYAAIVALLKDDQGEWRDDVSGADFIQDVSLIIDEPEAPAADKEGA